MLSRNECRLNFKNRPVRTGDIKGGSKQPPLPLIGIARSPATNRVNGRYFLASQLIFCIGIKLLDD